MTGRAPSGIEGRVLVCRGPVCAGKRGADRVWARMAEVLRERGLSDRIALDRQSCFGRCSRGPNVYVRMLPIDAGPGPHQRGLSSLYNWVGVEDVDADVAAIVSEHIVSRRVANPLIERAARLRASSMSEQPLHARSSPVTTDRDPHPRDPETT